VCTRMVTDTVARTLTPKARTARHVPPAGRGPPACGSCWPGPGLASAVQTWLGTHAGAVSGAAPAGARIGSGDGARIGSSYVRGFASAHPQLPPRPRVQQLPPPGVALPPPQCRPG